jgi:DNA-binding MarR family transcriptional regulator
MKIEAFTSSSYIFAIAHAYDVLWRGLNQKLKKSGCNVNEALVLIALYFEEAGRVTPSALSKALRTSRGNISHCLSHLEGKRLLKRVLSERDARQLIVALTPTGKRLAENLVSAFEELEAECEKYFSGVPSLAKNLIESLFLLEQ